MPTFYFLGFLKEHNKQKALHLLAIWFDFKASAIPKTNLKRKKKIALDFLFFFFLFDGINNKWYFPKSSEKLKPKNKKPFCCFL